MPERLQVEQGKLNAPSQFTFSAEAQMFSSANNLGQVDARHSVTNFHAGIEYIPGRPWLPIPFLPYKTKDGTKPAYVEPIRFGYHTDYAGNDLNGVNNIFANDYVVSAGTGLYYSANYGGGMDQYEISIEPTVEYFTVAKKYIYTISSSYRF